MKIINASFAGLAIIVLGGAALLPADAGQFRAKQPTVAQVDSQAKYMLDAFEKALLEPPKDRNFGISRMMTVIIPNHKNGRKEIPYGTSPQFFLGYMASAYSLGLFDTKGDAKRIRQGSLSRQKSSKPTESIRDDISKPIEVRLKSDSKKLLASRKKDFKSWAITSGKPLTIYSRAILPKKECLSCHTEAKMGKTMGVAALVLERREIKQPTRRP